MENVSMIHFEDIDEDINFDDIPEVTNFTGWVRNPPHLVKFKEAVKKAGRYYTRAFDHERGIVEIKEIESGTHKVLSVKIVAIDEVLHGNIWAKTEKMEVV